MNLKYAVLLFFLLLFERNVFSQSTAALMENIHYLPQVVGGGNWESKIAIKNLSALTGQVKLEFFDESGAPINFATDQGTTSVFNFELAPFSAPVNNPASKNILVTRQGSFHQGWARVKSELKLGVSLTFKQYSGNIAVGSAGVKSSPAMPVFSVDLDPDNGLAVINPNRDLAQMKVRVFDPFQGELSGLERNITLSPGQHLAKLFFQAPFNFGTQKGTVVISSNVPLSAVALNIDGLVFATIPILPAPRRVDLPLKKIGVMYFVPSDRTPQPNVAERADEAFRVYQKLLDHELPLNGYESPTIPVDRDENGLPKVIVIPGQKLARQYLIAEATSSNWINDTLDVHAILKEIHPFETAIHKEYDTVIMFVETWELNYQGQPPVGFIGIAVPRSPWAPGVGFVSSLVLPFLREDILGDSSSYMGQTVPEFGGIKWPITSLSGFGKTKKQAADFAFFLVGHEFSHALGFPLHTSTGDFYYSKYESLMGSSNSRGNFREDGETQAILLPPEAKILALSPGLNPEVAGWINRDSTPPQVKIILQEYSEGQLYLILATDDPESGIASVVVDGEYYILYFHELTHTDRGDIDIMVAVSESQKTAYLVVGVSNGEGEYVFSSLVF